MHGAAAAADADADADADAAAAAAAATDTGDDAAALTRDYIRNSSLLINLAKAIGKLVISYQQVQNLAGYTTLIYEMKEVLEDLVRGRFVRTQVVNDKMIQSEKNFS